MANLPDEDVNQRELVNKLAKSISGLCHTVIARRLGQFFEVIAEELQKNPPVCKRCGHMERFKGSNGCSCGCHFVVTS